MNKYLFFRTDRIGDFLVSILLINSIKKNNNNSHFTIVCSKKNYKYIKDFKYINKVILYPENNILKKIIFFIKLLFKKYYCSIVFDSKNRSIFSSIITNSKKKILITNKKEHIFFLKTLFDKIYLDANYSSKISILRKIAVYLKIKFNKNDMNAFNFRIIKNPFGKKKINFIKKKFILLNFDEKWIYKQYIKDYKKIEPTYENFIKFIVNIVKKSKKDLVITNGYMTNTITNKIKQNFQYLNKGMYLMKIKKKKIILFDNINFFSLEYLISRSILVITCHGAASHVAASLKKKIIDIIEFKKIKFYKKWTEHYTNHLFIMRKDFSKLSLSIINKLNN